MAVDGYTAVQAPRPAHSVVCWAAPHACTVPSPPATRCHHTLLLQVAISASAPGSDAGGSSGVEHLSDEDLDLDSYINELSAEVEAAAAAEGGGGDADATAAGADAAAAGAEAADAAAEPADADAAGGKSAKKD